MAAQTKANNKLKFQTDDVPTQSDFADLIDSFQDVLAEGEFVDGDKTKLDGIEANADVTDTANVTAAGALMDSEVTNLADVKAFDPADYAAASVATLASTAVQPNDDADVLGSGAATDGQVLTADGTGGAAWETLPAAGGGISNVVDDTTPQLGGNLDLNGNVITGMVIGTDIQAYSAVLAATTASFTTEDETKLDAIEAGADVTDTANVTAAGALMDSEVTNLAAVKAFDPADYATDTQGALADTAVQPAALSGYSTTGHTHTLANITDATEGIQDIVGAMVTGNTETNVTVTYQDADGTLDFAVDLSAYATLTGAQTLTNKTLTSPELTTPTVGGVPLYANLPQNSQSAAYTLVLTDAQKHIYHPAADTTARTFTIPANASVAFPIGTAVTFINDIGAGVATIAITTDTLAWMNGASSATGSRTLAAGGMATAVKVTSTRWVISGVGIS